MKSTQIFILLLLLIIVLLIFISINTGSIAIDWDQFFSTDDKVNSLILNLRFYKIWAILLAGMSLPVSGFLLQEYFKNPLAGPSVLGISSASGLAIALLIFLGIPVINNSIFKEFPFVIAGLLGAFLGLLILSLVSLKLKDTVYFIILGFLFSAFAGAIINILEFYSDNNSLKQFVIWSFGSFTGLSVIQLIIFTILVLIGLLLAFLSLKYLQGNILGEFYAYTVGVNLNKMKYLVVISTSILVGSCTSFLGPIVFVGIIIPHIARKIANPSMLFLQFYLNILIGISFLLIVSLLSDYLKIPINSITALIGIPFTLFILLNNRVRI